MNDDPRSILANSRMGAFQIAAVGVCVLLNALDGFDVLSISFASPGIAAEWGVSRGALGIVLSMELIGMAIGSIFIGSVADAIGRRPVILGSLVCMVIGMFLASTASGIEILSAYRFFTGLGIGGMLASINAMAAEYSNARHKNLAVTIMAAGYPVGAIIGGAVSSALLAHYDWRSVFLFGAAATAVFFPLVWFLLPEAIEYLTHKRPAGALEKINKTLKRMGHPTVEALPEVSGEKEKHVGVAKLFSPALARTTVLLTVTYFMHILTFYFMLKWIPKIIVDMGFAASEAGGVLVWANVGGASGAFLLGILTQRFGVRGLTITRWRSASSLSCCSAWDRRISSNCRLSLPWRCSLSMRRSLGSMRSSPNPSRRILRAGGTGLRHRRRAGQPRLGRSSPGSCSRAVFAARGRHDHGLRR
ncbi:MAG: MFS transporter [Parvularculaceae bacterium]